MDNSNKKYEDKNGNSPEVGGFIVKTNIRLLIRKIEGSIIITDDGDNDEHCRIKFIPKLIEREYTFEPKPEKPKRKIPKDGVPVKVWNPNSIYSKAPKIRISKGVINNEGRLICYYDGLFVGPSDASWESWEGI